MDSNDYKPSRSARLLLVLVCALGVAAAQPDPPSPAPTSAVAVVADGVETQSTMRPTAVVGAQH